MVDMSLPPLHRALSLIVLGSFLVVAPARSGDAIKIPSDTAFDAGPWVDDLNQTQQAVAHKIRELGMGRVRTGIGFRSAFRRDQEAN